MDELPGAAGAAFRRLYEEMAPEVFGYARVRLSEVEAEDITAEVFHAAVVAINDGRGEQVTRAWLMTVARNKVVDRWRRAERDERAMRTLRRRQEEEFPIQWAHEATRDTVLDALDRLPLGQRRLLVMKYVDSLPVRDIATVLHRTEGATESALARARRAFKKAMAEVHDER